MNLALVLGLSIHGLAVCRSLRRAGIPTVAIAATRAPAIYTRAANVIVDPSVNSKSLVDMLESLTHRLPSEDKVVLFPTNDLMVREIGQAWDRLKRDFLLSWSETIEIVLKLQRKDLLPQIARDADTAHPESLVIHGLADIARVESTIGFPCLVKPAQPLSSFKAKIIGDEEEFRRNLRLWEQDLPLVAQQFVNGTDACLYFYSGIWHRGEEIGALTGRKLQASPPDLGQGTVLESRSYPDVLAAGRKFAKYSGISGPVAIEFKRSERGDLVMIEPNVGRTEYCVDLTIQSGLNLPVIEYGLAVGAQSTAIPEEPSHRVWYDTDKDTLCYVRDALAHRSFFPRGARPVFPYFGSLDLLPWISSCGFLISRIVKGAFSRVRAVVTGKSRLLVRTNR